MASVCCALNSELHNIVCLQYSVFFHQFGPGGLGKISDKTRKLGKFVFHWLRLNLMISIIIQILVKAQCFFFYFLFCLVFPKNFDNLYKIFFCKLRLGILGLKLENIRKFPIRLKKTLQYVRLTTSWSLRWIVTCFVGHHADFAVVVPGGHAPQTGVLMQDRECSGKILVKIRGDVQIICEI